MSEIHPWWTLPKAGKTQFPKTPSAMSPTSGRCATAFNDIGRKVAGSRVAESQTEHLTAPSSALQPRGISAYGNRSPTAVSKLSASSCEHQLSDHRARALALLQPLTPALFWTTTHVVLPEWWFSFPAPRDPGGLRHLGLYPSYLSFDQVAG